MTENKKQELRHLLQKATESLKVELNSTNKPQLPSVIDVSQYSSVLQQAWQDHSLSTPSLAMCYKARVTSESARLQLLDFIRTEYAQFINEEDYIQSACTFISRTGPFQGFPLDYLLEQLLKIAIVYGIEKAVSDFERGIENGQQSFRYIALLKGVRVETEIQIFKGVRLVPLPLSTSEISNYLPDMVNFSMFPDSLMGKTLLIIDASVSPIFHKPYPELFNDDFHEDKLPFHVEVAGGKFSDFKVEEFYKNFCQALSLSGNSAVQTVIDWRSLPQDELFNLSTLSVNHIAHHYNAGRLNTFIDVDEVQVQKIQCLYDVLTDCKTETHGKLQIPIDRWIKSKADQDPVDKMIDLGIAFESLYLSGDNQTSELSLRLQLRAAWFLGKDKTHRQELMADFRDIYKLRSKAVHTGKLSSRKNKESDTEEIVTEFIPKAQDLCRDSIVKILKEGKIPDWNTLILG
ncbi:hypothetical protein F4054_11380 [Candidatus Poribacteria bacterium]|nr:hypothetical protein [Candidatus Poribacteria bacterium]MYK22846.1 hypothetical protein [Candidatus Poribacteria bacterium]